jgi:hypothetical protein
MADRASLAAMDDIKDGAPPRAFGGIGARQISHKLHPFVEKCLTNQTYSLPSPYVCIGSPLIAMPLGSSSEQAAGASRVSMYRWMVVGAAIAVVGLLALVAVAGGADGVQSHGLDLANSDAVKQKVEQSGIGGEASGVGMCGQLWGRRFLLQPGVQASIGRRFLQSCPRG